MERRFAEAASRLQSFETRTVSATDATGWLTEGHGFGCLKTVIMVERAREILGKPPAEAEYVLRYGISSLAANLLRRAPGKQSLSQRNRTSAWTDSCLACVIAG